MEKKEEGIHRVVVNEEEVALKKDFMGWRVVHPTRNTDGSINWENIISGGSWIKTILVLIFIVILLGAIFEYYSQLVLLTKCLTALNDTVMIITP